MADEQKDVEMTNNDAVIEEPKAAEPQTDDKKKVVEIPAPPKAVAPIESKPTSKLKKVLDYLL